MSDPILTIISKLKTAQMEIAVNNCLWPKPAEWMHTEAGKYQGVQLALDIIDNVLRDNISEEEQS